MSCILVSIDDKQPGLLCRSREILVDTTLDTPRVIGCCVDVDTVIELLGCKPLRELLFSCGVPGKWRRGFAEQRPCPRDSIAYRFLAC